MTSFLLLALVLALPCGHSVRTKHPAPGTSLVHFAQVDEGIYKGSKPKNNADFQFLKSKNIKCIMDLNFLPLFSIAERRRAREFHITFVRIPMNASPLQPSEEHVIRALRLLRDEQSHPIYFHCELGRDRTSLLQALYDMYFRGMSQQDAWKQMKEAGYKDWWGIRGLKKYFLNHPTLPEQYSDNARH